MSTQAVQYITLFVRAWGFASRLIGPGSAAGSSSPSRYPSSSRRLARRSASSSRSTATSTTACMRSPSSRLFALWSRSTGYDLVAAMRRRWLLAVGLGLAAAGVMAVMVVRTDDATARPDGLELVGAVLWRGVVYGVTDGLLLSVVSDPGRFRRLAGSKLNQRLAGKVVIGIRRSPRVACDDRRVSRRLQRLPFGESGQATRRRRRLERPDARHSEPDRSAHRTCGSAHIGSATQLRDRYVPATARVARPSTGACPAYPGRLHTHSWRAAFVPVGREVL